MVLLSISLLIFLLYISSYPLLTKAKKAEFNIHNLSLQNEATYTKPFSIIGATLDFSKADSRVIQYLSQLVDKNCEIHLFHITKSVIAKRYGDMANDLETNFDLNELKKYKLLLLNKGFKNVTTTLGYGIPSISLPKFIINSSIELLIMEKHGHKGWSIFLFETTTDKIKHKTDIPILIV